MGSENYWEGNLCTRSTMNIFMSNKNSKTSLRIYDFTYQRYKSAQNVHIRLAWDLRLKLGSNESVWSLGSLLRKLCLHNSSEKLGSSLKRWIIYETLSKVSTLKHPWKRSKKVNVEWENFAQFKRNFICFKFEWQKPTSLKRNEDETIFSFILNCDLNCDSWL